MKQVLFATLGVSLIALTGCATTQMNSNTTVATNTNSVVSNANMVNTNSSNSNTNGATTNDDLSTYENEEYGFSLEYPKDFNANVSTTAGATSSNNYLLLEVGFKPTGVLGEPLRIVLIEHSLDNWDDLDASSFGTVTAEQQQINGRTWHVLENGIQSILATEEKDRTYVLIINNDVSAEQQWSDAHDTILNSFNFNS